MSRSPRQRRRRRLAFFLLLLAAYSVHEYLDTGTLRWPGALYDRATQALAASAGREDSGWGRAADAAESLGAAREGQPPPAFDFTGRVVRVADGDTVSVLDRDNVQHKVRLFGIDTPEKDQPYGNQSRRALADLVDSRQVGVVIVETDDYGRTVGNIYRDETFVNLAMIAGGHAWWYRYYAPHEHAFDAAERGARERGMGLWAGNRPIPPWDWRRGRR